jgi:hypothetical protein
MPKIVWPNPERIIVPSLADGTQSLCLTFLRVINAFCKMGLYKRPINMGEANDIFASTDPKYYTDVYQDKK